LFAPNDDQLLLACVREFLRDGNSSRMRAAARRQFEDRYSAESNVQRLLEIYQQAQDTARR
jgi:glycosyltransferase involved in cell wall biosynthesis